MNQDQQLEDLINDALDKGWQPLPGIHVGYLYAEVKSGGKRIIIGYTDKNNLEVPLTEYSAYGVIYDHGFAEAVWGNDLIHYHGGRWTQEGDPSPFSSRTPFVYPMWEYRLKEMVGHPDPIQYLLENHK